MPTSPALTPEEHAAAEREANRDAGFGVVQIGLVSEPRHVRERLYAKFARPNLTPEQRKRVRAALVRARGILTSHHTYRHAHSRDERGRRIHDPAAWAVERLKRGEEIPV